MNARLVDLCRIPAPSGNLTPVDCSVLGFPIRRAYYLYDVPGGESRGGHAHIALEQFIVAVAGSFDVVLDDGTTRQTFPLARPFIGLYVPPMLWRELVNFSSGSVGLVFASEHYDEADYIRDYAEFRAWAA